MTRPQIAVYYFPNYHIDPRNEKAHGKGWTEWDLVKLARPRFPGHAQPRVPMWGYEDESDPVAMARKIDAAADHGVDCFIFDWYFYDDGPYLERGLEHGFLRATNNRRLKFALMWANHDWIDIHPAKHSAPANLQFLGRVTRATFDRVCDYVIERYFTHPSYWRVDGKPYFSVYELFKLIDGLGGVEATADALASFHDKARRAGFTDGVHLNAVVWGVKILPGETAVKNPRELLAKLGFESATTYVWVHHVQLREFPETAYEKVAAEAASHWPRAAADLGVPYHPNVTMGWDASPRTVQSDAFEPRGYPFMATMGGNTPARFRDALEACKRYIDSSSLPASHRILTINAWNEWTEGSYLEPDTVQRSAYLEAIREVFGVAR